MIADVRRAIAMYKVHLMPCGLQHIFKHVYCSWGVITLPAYVVVTFNAQMHTGQECTRPFVALQHMGLIAMNNHLTGIRKMP